MLQIAIQVQWIYIGTECKLNMFAFITQNIETAVRLLNKPVDY